MSSSGKKRIHYAWIILITVSVIRGISGPAINASSGLFLTPVSKDMNVGIGSLSIYLSVSSVVSLLFLPFAGRLLNRFGAKKIGLAAAALQTLAFAALGFSRSVWWFYLLAVPLAIGAICLVNLLGPVLISRWFQSGIGLVMGLMMAITSLFGALYQPLLTGLIESRGWRFAYKSFGLYALILLLVVILCFLSDSPEKKKLAPYQGKDSLSKEKARAAAAAPDIPAEKAIKSLPFFMILFFMVVLTAFASFSQHMTTYGLVSGYTLSTIGTALSLSMAGSAVGAILVGVLSDKAGIIPTCIMVMGVALICVLLFFAGAGSFLIFSFAAFLHGLATSSIGVVAPLLTSYFFGLKDYEKLFSLVMMGSPFATIILLPAYGFIYDAMGSYTYVLLFLCVLVVLGGLSLVLAQKNHRRHLSS